MSQNLLRLTVAALALSSLAIAATVARPGIGGSERMNMTRPDFDRVFSDAVSVSVPSFTDADLEALRQSGLKRMKRTASERKIQEA